MAHGKTEIFASGFDFPEGPSFDRTGNLYVTDSQRGAVIRVSPAGGTSVFVESKGGPNGSAFHKNGNLYAAEPGGKRIIEINPDGVLQIIANKFEDKPLLAPNDITFDMEGAAYFSDPGESRLDNPFGRVFRIQPTGNLALIADKMAYPNGLAISPDGKHLIVAETFSEKLHRFSLDESGNTIGREEFAYVGTGHDNEVGPDGMAFDEAGYLYVAIFGGGVVAVVSPDGDVIDHIPAGGLRPTNVAFGGEDNRYLFITETENRIVSFVQVARPGLRLFGTLS